MSLHDDIVALPYEHKTLGIDGYSNGYRDGHRFARHAAAELAQQSDAELARLRAACADLRGGIYAGRSALALVQAECERLRVALRFYARGEHFIVSDCTAWDTVSGEPQNWQCDESGTATIEDGSIAAAVLRGEAMPLDEDDTPQPIEGERAALTGAST